MITNETENEKIKEPQQTTDTSQKCCRLLNMIVLTNLTPGYLLHEKPMMLTKPLSSLNVFLGDERHHAPNTTKMPLLTTNKVQNSAKHL